MYKQFNLSSILLRAIDKRIDLKFNFDIDESSVRGDSLVITTLDGDHIPFKFRVKGEIIGLYLDEWPAPNTIYQIVIEKEIKNISGQTLNSAIRRKLIFKSEITSKVTIKSPYNFQKFEDELLFEWEDSDQFNSYYVEIAKENRFYNLVYSGDVYTNSISPVIPELKPGQYYFRCRVQKDGEYGPWSQIITFIYKYVCDDDYPKDDGPSADAEMPSAWDDLYNTNNPDVGGGGENSSSIPDDDNSIEVEDELEVITAPVNGETPLEFIFEFDRELDTLSGSVILVRRDF